ncbi:MAG TPA: alpha/beta hydrolase [Bryobacteraceae bacterium]|nr:alpha/beta hydrolase [Bryobacteraceae bacterium]
MILHVEGAGPAMVVLQGGPGLSSRSVAPITDLLQDNFRVIRFDHTGWTVSDVLDQLEAVRNEVGEESWFVLAHSWGAALAAIYAREHPERVRGLILAHPLEISSAFCDGVGDLLCGADDPFALEHDSDVSEMLWEDLEATCPDATAEGYDLAPVARQIPVPTLVLLGGRDAIDHRSGQLWAELTNAQLVSFPGAGHWSFLEQPTEFQQAVTEFLMTHTARHVMTAVG